MKKRIAESTAACLVAHAVRRIAAAWLASFSLFIGLFVAGPALAQQQQHVKVISRTLVANSAYRECMAVSDQQTLRYWYRGDALLDFKLQSAAEAVSTLKTERQALGSGSFSPKTSGDYCMVWTNTSKKALLFRVEFARLPR